MGRNLEPRRSKKAVPVVEAAPAPPIHEYHLEEEEEEEDGDGGGGHGDGGHGGGGHDDIGCPG